MADKKFLKKYGYEITGDPKKPDHPYHYDRELEVLLADTIEKVNRRGGEMVEKLNKLTIRHPNVPHFKNYLSTAFRIAGNFKKAEEVNDWMLSEHPAYLFGRINKAAIAIEARDYEKIPEYLGAYMDIKMLYPQREIFHTSEVLSFNKIAVLYFIGIDDDEQAKIRLDIMTDIDKYHRDTTFADMSYHKYLMAKISAELKQKTEGLWAKKSESADAPQFQNPEVWELYEYDLLIDHDIIRRILALPRESVIADLELVLDDCMERFDYYKDLDFEWTSEHSCAPTHAIFILSELKSEKSLPKILEIFGKDKEFLDYWFGEYLYGLLWEPVMKLGNIQLPALKAFALNIENDKYARTVMPAAVSQLALNMPERRADVIEWCREIMEYYLGLTEDIYQEDADFLGFMVSDVLDFVGVELSDLLKKLYEEDLPEETITNYDDVLIELETPRDVKDRKHPLLNIYDRYTEVLSTWAGYSESEGHADGIPDLFESTADFFRDKSLYNKTHEQHIMAAQEPKVGRNDPCICGSGKKYKKCCGK
jgi:hypothetical protein